MYGEFQVGGTFPRPEDKARLKRYEQGRFLFDGKHYDHEAAKRIEQKLKQNYDYYGRAGLIEAEGSVYIVYNLPRLILQKRADLQVLQSPHILVDAGDGDTQSERAEAILNKLRDDVPDLWARVHFGRQLGWALGDAVFTISRKGEDEGGRLDFRTIEPDTWFPVLDDNDHLKVLAHQIAWTEDHDDGKDTHTYLRVDVCYPDRVERRAFLLEGKSQDGGLKDIEAEVELSLHWGDLPERDEADLGGLMSCIHIPNGQMEAGSIFGRPEFYDSSSLIDDINWRLATWSDANDKVSHPARIVPQRYIRQDEDDYVLPPSRYTDIFQGNTRDDGTGNVPQYMTFELAYDTLKDQFEASVLALLVRHEMSPALLGLQFGRERESGEAKSLGMGTTEAATRRDLLTAQPMIDRALTAMARLAGESDVEVRTHWRVGLPKTQAELMQELQQKRTMGLVTRRDMLEQLYPWWSADQIDAKLAELDEERQAAIDEMDPQVSEVG